GHRGATGGARPRTETAPQTGPLDAVPAPAARAAVAGRLLRPAADLPGVDVRPDRLPGGGLPGHLALRHLLGRPVRVLAAVRPLRGLRGLGDRAVPAAGLPAGVPDRLPRGTLAEPDHDPGDRAVLHQLPDPHPDRKSTRLNSSHVKISYAVFCLKK